LLCSFSKAGVPVLMTKHPFFDYSRLTPSERLELAQDLWDSVDPASDTTVLPLTEEQSAELDRRLAELEVAPDAAASWPDVRKRVVDKLEREHRCGTGHTRD